MNNLLNALYSPALLALAAAQRHHIQQQYIQQSLLHNQQAKMLFSPSSVNRMHNKLENSTGSTTTESYSTTSGESLNQSNLINEGQLSSSSSSSSSPYNSTASSVPSSSDSTPNTQISLNSYNQQKQHLIEQQHHKANNNLAETVIKKKINFANISSLVD